MWEWLERLRKQPEAIRRKAAFFMAGGITLLIVLVWGLVEFRSQREVYLPEPPPSAFTSVKEDLEKLEAGAQVQARTWRSLVEVFRSLGNSGSE